MSMSEILPLLITTLFGGGIGVLLNHKLNNRKEGTNEFQILLKERKEIADELKINREEMSKKIEALETQLKELLEQRAAEQLEKVQLKNEIKGLKEDIVMMLPMLEQALQPYPDMQWMLTHLNTKFSGE